LLAAVASEAHKPFHGCTVRNQQASITDRMMASRLCPRARFHPGEQTRRAVKGAARNTMIGARDKQKGCRR